MNSKQVGARQGLKWAGQGADQPVELKLLSLLLSQFLLFVEIGH
jgi:hypothetical protein